MLCWSTPETCSHFGWNCEKSGSTVLCISSFFSDGSFAGERPCMEDRRLPYGLDYCRAITLRVWPISISSRGLFLARGSDTGDTFWSTLPLTFVTGQLVLWRSVVVCSFFFSYSNWILVLCCSVVFKGSF